MIRNTKYAYYKIYNIIKEKSYYGIIDIVLNQILFNTDKEITKIKPYIENSQSNSPNSILVLTSNSAYRICALSVDGNCIDSGSCSSGSFFVDSQGKNFCGDKCDKYYLIPNKICVTECDENIYYSNDSYHCGFCIDMDESQPYKLLNRSGCLSYIPEGAYLYNSKYKLLKGTISPTTTIPTTIQTTILTTIITTILTTNPTTIPITIQGSIQTKIPTSIPTTILTTIQTNIANTIQTAIPKTIFTSIINTVNIKIMTTIPKTIYKTILTTFITENNINELNIQSDEDNDNNIEYLRNKLGNTYIKEKQLEEIKNGNDLILIEKNELKISLVASDKLINKNNTTIILGECENNLKEFYNISKNESLLILKVEVIKADMKKPRIEYEVYYPTSENKLYKLDLNICEKTTIIISNPMNLEEKNIDKYNSSSDYYKDICYTYSTENGTDIILNDRKEEYINNDLSPCEENCNYTNYDYENNVAICSCKVKKELKKYSEININKTLLYMSFTDIKNIINLNVMNCYKKLFYKKGILYNIGFYIILFAMILYFITVIIFRLKDYKIIKSSIENLNNMSNKDINKISDEKEANRQTGINSFVKKKKNLVFINNLKTKEEPPIKKKKSKILNKRYTINVSQTTNLNQNIGKDLNDNSKRIIKQEKEKNININSEYNTYILNDLE